MPQKKVSNKQSKDTSDSDQSLLLDLLVSRIIRIDPISSDVEYTKSATEQGTTRRKAPKSRKKHAKRRVRVPACAVVPKSSLTLSTVTYYIGGNNGQSIVDRVLTKQGWTRTFNKYHPSLRFKWAESINPLNYLRFREGRQLINHIPNNRLLTNKLGLLTSLQRYERLTPLIKGRLPRLQISDFLPETYRLDDRVEKQRFLQAFHPGDTWICKPTGNNQGRGIFLIRSPEELTSQLEEKDKTNESRSRLGCRQSNGSNHIIQRYIDRPLLLAGHKFDLRVYMCIASTLPYLVLYRHGYVRRTVRPYDIEASEISTHLTNQFIQKKDPLYRDYREETAWSWEQLNDYINTHIAGAAGVEHNWVYHTLGKKLQKISLHCFNSVKHRLERKLGFFDLLGLDFMIDERLNVYLIEINTNPSLCTNCRAMSDLIPEVVEESILIAIECWTKAREGKPILPCEANKRFSILYCGEQNSKVSSVSTMTRACSEGGRTASRETDTRTTVAQTDSISLGDHIKYRGVSGESGVYRIDDDLFKNNIHSEKLEKRQSATCRRNSSSSYYDCDRSIADSSSETKPVPIAAS